MVSAVSTQTNPVETSPVRPPPVQDDQNSQQLLDRLPDTQLEQFLAQPTPGERLSGVSDQPTAGDPTVLTAQAVPNPQPGPSRNTADHVIGEYRSQINAAAGRHGVAPEVVGGILFDELTHRGGEDDRQDELAAKVAATAPGSAERAQAIRDANGDWNINPPVIGGNKDITRNVTIGNAQMSVDGLRSLVNSENGRNYLEGIISRDAFNKDPVGNSLKILTNDKLAPFVIGAWAEKQVDTRSGKQRDGITYPRFGKDDNANLHYVFLTGTYSKGGYFQTTDWKGNSTGKIDKERTANPLAFTDFSRNVGPNQSATDGLTYRERINRTLNGQPWP